MGTWVRRLGIGLACAVALVACTRDAPPPAPTPRQGALAAVATPSIWPEHELEAAVLTDHYSQQNGAVVAPGAASDFVVWRDNRDITTSSSQYFWEVFGARVGHDGTLLDKQSVRISQTGTSKSDLAIASNGTVALVAWLDSGSPKALRAVRVSLAGKVQVVDVQPLALGGTDYSQAPIRIATDGTDFVVAWGAAHVPAIGPNVWSVRTTRVPASGALAGPNGTDVVSAIDNGPTPGDLAWNGSAYVLSFHTGPGLATPSPHTETMRLDRDGKKIDGAGMVSPGARAEFSALAWSGTQLLLAWVEDNRIVGTNIGDSQVFARRLTATGAPADDKVLALGSIANPGIVRSLDVVATGTDFVVDWVAVDASEQGTLLARHVDAAGGLAEAAPLTVIGPALPYTFSGRLTWDGQAFHSVVTGGVYRRIQGAAAHVVDEGIFGQRFGADLKSTAARFSISALANRHDNLALVGSGNTYLMAYDDDRAREDRNVYNDSNNDIYGCVVTLGAAGAVTTKVTPWLAGPLYDYEPGLALDGADVLFTHSTSSRSAGGEPVTVEHLGLDAARVAPAAKKLPDAVVRFPSLAFNGTDYLLEWAVPSVGARRLSAAGDSLDTPSLYLSMGTVFGDVEKKEARARVAAAGTDFLVTWPSLGERAQPPVEDDIYAAIVSGGGVLLGGKPFAIAAGIGPQRLPVVGSSGASFLVAWQDDTGATHGVRATRVGRDGHVDSPAGVVIAAAGERPAVAWIGNAYLVVWVVPGGNAMAGALVDEAGQPLAGHDVSLAAVDSGPTDLELAWGGQQTALLAYRRVDPELGVMRLRVRSIDLTGAPVPADAGAPPPSDASAPDASAAPSDASTPSPDASAPSPDASTSPDASAPPDARDAGVTTSDASAGPDAPVVPGTDGGIASDGATSGSDAASPATDAGPMKSTNSSGCACATAPSDPRRDGLGLLAFVLLALATLPRRRARPAARGRAGRRCE